MHKAYNFNKSCACIMGLCRIGKNKIYNAHGQLIRTWGDTTYPVSYEFDAYDRMTNMATYRAGEGWTGTTWPTGTVGTADNTYWHYDEASGLLESKHYADGKGPDYTYSTDGKLLTRTWAREGSSLTTTYVYTNTGKWSESTTPHAFRRSCTTELLRGGANMYHVKELLGHESLETIKHYARLTITDLKKTHAQCHPREKDAN